MTSRGRVRRWIIDNVFLFEAQALVDELRTAGVKIGIATSVRKHMWEKAEIHPIQGNNLIELSKDQRDALDLFNSRNSG
jgi:hypothetical protein